MTANHCWWVQEALLGVPDRAVGLPQALPGTLRRPPRSAGATAARQPPLRMACRPRTGLSRSRTPPRPQRPARKTSTSTAQRRRCINREIMSGSWCCQGHHCHGGASGSCRSRHLCALTGAQEGAQEEGKEGEASQEGEAPPEIPQR